MIDNAPERSVHVMHSHTNSTPPSVRDFEHLLHESVDRISVIAHNEDVFSVYVGDGEKPDVNRFRYEVKSISNEVYDNLGDLLGFADWTYEERQYAAIREQAYRIVRHFKWTMEGGYLNE